MNTDLISAPLKRNLKPGSKYNKLFPKVSCQTTNLGNGSNDTIEGVDFMAQWVEKYSWQVKKLVDVLKREGALRSNTLFNLAQDIYKFEYNHLQYTADAALQQLRSPACAWQQRKQGLDCKSYTIFAMAMLQQLGVSAAIRQVKQPGANSDLWTHVYVVVPKNQDKPTLKDLENENDYLVIDATRHSNIEVGFIDKKDKMIQKHQYVGLNAPSSGKQLLTEAEKQSLEKLTSFFKAVGYSSSTINKMYSYLEELMLQGYSKDQILIYPSEKGTNIQPSKNEPGKLFLLPVTGLRGDETNIDFGDVYSSVSDSGWFNSTFGAILSNGFNLSCWGSSNSPKKAKEFLQKDLGSNGILKASGLTKSNPTINDLNRFIEMATMYAHIADDKRQSMSSSCSKEGFKLLDEKMTEFRDKVIQQLSQKISALGGQLLPANNLPQLQSNNAYKVTTGGVKLPFTSGGYYGFNRGNTNYWVKRPIPIKKIVGGSNVLPPVDPPSNDTGSSNNNAGSIFDTIKDVVTGGNSFSEGSPGYGSTTYEPGQVKKVTDKKTSSTSTNLSTASVGIAAGALILLWPTLKKQLAKNKKSTPKTK
ncbi:hypothetical protein LX95_01292 [Mesonia algae]|uniref:Transglutaminase superfamily protein n=1 Tax=Mesonia algae TaxID=213248 RepID=A0A2W7I402_9FLAO|nr:hypothetical protein [Mesonia algae]PZW41611.1 hypothetical protein LX95_01292 [Mesonia algae]